MNPTGIALIVFGVMALAIAGINAPKAPNISYLIGTFLPGLVCLILGLKLGQTKKPEPRRRRQRRDDDEPDDERSKKKRRDNDDVDNRPRSRRPDRDGDMDDDDRRGE